MVWTIVKRELLDHLMSLRFLLGMAICLVLVLLSTYVSVKDYERRIGDYQTALEEYRAKSPRLRYRQCKAFRKPEVLSVFSIGEDRRLGSVVDIGYEPPYRASGFMGWYWSQHIRWASRFATIDFAFVVRVIISFLALFLAYDTISGEREGGTLRLLLSNSLPRATLLAGKFIAGMGALLISVTVSLIAAILIARLSSAVHFGTEEWIRIGLIGLSALLYAAAFFGLGMLLSCVTRSAHTTLLVSVIVWISLLVLWPNASVALAERVVPIPSAEAMEKRIADIAVEFNEKMKKVREEHPGGGKELFEVFDRKFWTIGMARRDYINRILRQTEFARGLSRISPGATFSYLVQALARTDLASYQRFMESVWAYYEKRRELNRMVFIDREKFLTLRESFPIFKAADEDVSHTLNRSLFDLSLLLLFNVLFFMISYASFVRAEV